MSERLVTIKVLPSPQAHLWKHKLESLGIQAFVAYERFGTRGNGVDFGCALQVKERDVAKASKILNDIPPLKIPLAKRSNTLAFLIVGCILLEVGLYLLLTTTYDVGGMVMLVTGIGSIIVFILGFFIK